MDLAPEEEDVLQGASWWVLGGWRGNPLLLLLSRRSLTGGRLLRTRDATGGTTDGVGEVERKIAPAEGSVVEVVGEGSGEADEVKDAKAHPDPDEGVPEGAEGGDHGRGREDRVDRESQKGGMAVHDLEKSEKMITRRTYPFGAEADAVHALEEGSDDGGTLRSVGDFFDGCK